MANGKSRSRQASNHAGHASRPRPREQGPRPTTSQPHVEQYKKLRQEQLQLLQLQQLQQVQSQLWQQQLQQLQQQLDSLQLQHLQQQQTQQQLQQHMQEYHEHQEQLLHQLWTAAAQRANEGDEQETDEDDASSGAAEPYEQVFELSLMGASPRAASRGGASSAANAFPAGASLGDMPLGAGSALGGGASSAANAFPVGASLGDIALGAGSALGGGASSASGEGEGLEQLIQAASHAKDMITAAAGVLSQENVSHKAQLVAAQMVMEQVQDAAASGNADAAGMAQEAASALRILDSVVASAGDVQPVKKARNAMQDVVVLCCCRAVSHEQKEELHQSFLEALGFADAPLDAEQQQLLSRLKNATWQLFNRGCRRERQRKGSPAAATVNAAAAPESPSSVDLQHSSAFTTMSWQEAAVEEAAKAPAAHAAPAAPIAGGNDGGSGNNSGHDSEDNDGDQDQIRWMQLPGPGWNYKIRNTFLEVDQASTTSFVPSCKSSVHRRWPKAALRHRSGDGGSALLPRKQVEEVLREIAAEEGEKYQLQDAAVSVMNELLGRPGLQTMRAACLVRSWYYLTRYPNAGVVELGLYSILQLIKEVQYIIDHHGEDDIVAHCSSALGTLVVAAMEQVQEEESEGFQDPNVTVLTRGGRGGQDVALQVAKRLVLTMERFTESGSVQCACAEVLLKVWEKLGLILGLSVRGLPQAPEVCEAQVAIRSAVRSALQHNSSRHLAYRLLARTQTLPEALDALGDFAVDAIQDILSELHEGLQQPLQWDSTQNWNGGEDSAAEMAQERELLKEVRKQSDSCSATAKPRPESSTKAIVEGAEAWLYMGAQQSFDPIYQMQGRLVLLGLLFGASAAVSPALFKALSSNAAEGYKASELVAPACRALIQLKDLGAVEETEAQHIILRLIEIPYNVWSYIPQHGHSAAVGLLGSLAEQCGSSLSLETLDGMSDVVIDTAIYWYDNKRFVFGIMHESLWSLNTIVKCAGPESRSRRWAAKSLLLAQRVTLDDYYNNRWKEDDPANAAFKEAQKLVVDLGGKS